MSEEYRITRRRALIGAGATVVIGVGTLLGINSLPDRESAVAEQAPASGGGDPEQWARHEHNLQRLRTTLGASDWRVEDRTIEGRPRAATLTLDPNSRPAKAFNKDHLVTATIDVERGGTVGPCPPPVNGCPARGLSS